MVPRTAAQGPQAPTTQWPTAPPQQSRASQASVEVQHSTSAGASRMTRAGWPHTTGAPAKVSQLRARCSSPSGWSTGMVPLAARLLAGHHT